MMMYCGSFQRSSMRRRATPGDLGSARRGGQHRDEPLVGTIEVMIDGVTVRIGAGAPADTIAAVLRALKAGA
jgi:hypothetical protein